VQASDGAPTPASDSGAASEGSVAGDAPGPGNGATPTLPAPTGACPTFANGMVTFSPAGISPRSAQVYMSSAAATMHGPLILYWYATYSSTAEVQYSLGSTLAAIEAAGGIVVAPVADPNAGMFQWYFVNGSSKLDDFQVADEIVACAAKNTGVDTTHIHTMGMSAGALQTTAMSFLRSSYLASVVTYSGGMQPGFSLAMQDPNNKFAALVFDGGTSDNVFNVNFQAASQTYYTTLKSDGHFAAICDHGMGHAIPTAAAPSVWAFFQANGFGVYPSPYAGGLPASFPSYCTL
jgi:predicted esterase